MAQIYVNSGLVKPKSIHIYNSSAQLWEEDKIGYVRVNGVWVPFIEYKHWVFEEGGSNLYNIKVVRRLGNAGLTVSDVIHFWADSTYESSLIQAASDYIDVTKYNKLFIDFDISRLATVRVEFGLGDYTTAPTGIVNMNYSVLHSARSVATRNTIELDTSSLQGQFRFMLNVNSQNHNRPLTNIYNAWLE